MKAVLNMEHAKLCCGLDIDVAPLSRQERWRINKRTALKTTWISAGWGGESEATERQTWSAYLYRAELVRNTKTILLAVLGYKFKTI